MLQLFRRRLEPLLNAAAKDPPQRMGTNDYHDIRGCVYPTSQYTPEVYPPWNLQQKQLKMIGLEYFLVSLWDSAYFQVLLLLVSGNVTAGSPKKHLRKKRKIIYKTKPPWLWCQKPLIFQGVTVNTRIRHDIFGFGNPGP